MDQNHQRLSLSCPICRQSALLPTDSVSGFKSAFHTNQLFGKQDALLTKAQKTVRCEKCRKYVVTSFCHGCGKFICAKCTEIHKNWKQLFSHGIVTIDRQGDMMQLVPPKVIFCSKHPTKDLDLYCETCKMSICRDCAVQGHHNHQFVVPAETQCAKSKEHATATSFCRDCDQFICAVCTETHKEWEKLASHEMITIDQLRGDVMQLISPQNKATLHFMSVCKLGTHLIEEMHYYGHNKAL